MERRQESFAQIGTRRVFRRSSVCDLTGRTSQGHGPPEPSKVWTPKDACCADTRLRLSRSLCGKRAGDFLEEHHAKSQGNSGFLIGRQLT